jgi:polyisoprenoid-binding protein YceI
VVFRVELGVSRFTIRAFATGMLSGFGHDPTFAIRRYTGEVHFDPDAPDTASMTLQIVASSLELTDDVSSRDRREIERVMHEEVLEDTTYPTIVYACQPPNASVNKTGDGQFDVAMAGTLTLHGQTRRQPISARIVAGPTMLRAYGEFKVPQSEFGIKPVSVAGSMLKVKDELTCSFDLVTRP